VLSTRDTRPWGEGCFVGPVTIQYSCLAFESDPGKFPSPTPPRCLVLISSCGFLHFNPNAQYWVEMAHGPGWPPHFWGPGFFYQSAQDGGGLFPDPPTPFFPETPHVPPIFCFSTEKMRLAPANLYFWIVATKPNFPRDGFTLSLRADCGDPTGP